jgi:hypothetical protein
VINVKKIERANKSKSYECGHITDGVTDMTFLDNGGIYISYKCPKCGDRIKDYYELANRYNETRDKEEPIPENE